MISLRPPPLAYLLLLCAALTAVSTLLWLSHARADEPAAVAAGETLGLPAMHLPADVRLEPSRVDLGHKLFFDRRLSFNGTMSCAMCHVPEEGFASNASRRGVGIEGKSLRRNTPSLLNVAWRTDLFLDGRESSLVTQAWGPLLHIDEMANPSVGHVIEKIRSLDDYRGRFEQVFGGAGPTMDTVGAALAAFQATLVAADSRFDRWLYRGEATALSASEQQGYKLFIGKARCAQCHSVGAKDALFADGKFHVTGGGFATPPARSFKVPLAPGIDTEITDADLEGFTQQVAPDLGRFEITLDSDDRYAFRTPTLRNVARSAPYMHDGSLASLEAVVDFYDRGGGEVVGKSELLKPLGLNKDEKRSLVEFIHALDSTRLPALIERTRETAAPRRDGVAAPVQSGY